MCLIDGITYKPFVRLINADRRAGSVNAFTPNSDHVMIHLEGYSLVICPHTQLIAWEYIQTQPL